MDNNGKFCMGARFKIFFPLLLFPFKIMIKRASKAYLKVHEKSSPSISKHRKGIVKNYWGPCPQASLHQSDLQLDPRIYYWETLQPCRAYNNNYYLFMISVVDLIYCLHVVDCGKPYNSSSAAP